MNSVWDFKDNEEITYNGNGSRPVRTCVYCRVSTDHDEQINALDNQVNWCSEFLEKHPGLKLIDDHHYSASKKVQIAKEILQKGFYIDAGKSGLDTKHRESFLRMISDAKNGKIDLIIVRDNCRFCRNLQDLINIVRDLRDNYNVGIYFASYKIFSIKKENDSQLSMLAIFAEEESKSISERIKSNNNILRKQGRLFGNGNILGYDLCIVENGSNKYTINEEQANVVRTIYELRSQGIGVQKIANQLVALGYKNSSGIVKWNYQNVLRILHNKTYCGYIPYNKVKTVDVLSKKRKNLKSDDAIYKKAHDIVPPIISEELFSECQEIMAKKKECFEPKGPAKAKSSKDIYARKMTCICGSGFRKDHWYTTQNGDTRFGYKCYNVLNNGSKSSYKQKGIDTTKMNLCDMPAITDLKMFVQAKYVFKLFRDDINLIDETLERYKRQASIFIRDYDSEIRKKRDSISKEKSILVKTIRMRTEGEITGEEFKLFKSETNRKIEQLESELSILETEKASVKQPNIDMEQAKNILCEILDCSKTVDNELIDRFVYQIVVKSPNHFVWRIHFKPVTADKPFFVHIKQFEISIEEIKSYARSQNRRLKGKWEPITVEVELLS